MKFTAILISAFAGLALAAPQPQEATPSALTSSFSVSSTVVLSDASTTVSLTPVQTCLAACPIEDVTCKARCVGAARPNESQVNQTNECVAQCDQGDGSPAATERYSQCTQNCIASYYPSTQTVGGVVGSGASTAASNAASVTSGAAASVSSAAASLSGGECLLRFGMED
ncbi:hypothetical protein W97_03473 [Coniosporium apollinis CBS 100218]|uniref:Uncharacterized protein n=1 Tax=Coniosporium apollinis (strain CBS 100218) TaxID=1168221 RepID=R7YQQ8_CONA1|nr:uncharacterized protein W97_03473 [Coniosporium apollinis CBS 100218]EON64242.1 hypothetical protein W97_03473 [Coniosporium apollinis CBS 100218]